MRQNSTLTESWQIRTGDIISGVSLPIMFLEEQNIRRSGYWGRIDNLEIVLPENKLDEIVITLGLAEYHKLERIVKMCEKSGVHTKFIPDYNNVIPTKPYTEDLQGLPVINIRRVPLSDPLNKWMKRGVDIFGAIEQLFSFLRL